MTLEATLICVDNSEYSRNGDFAPSRLAAQVDAIGLIASAKLSQHFENLVGIVCLAGTGSRLVAAPSSDLGTFLTGLQLVKPQGEPEFIKAIQTAQLALKHRLNKSQQPRIICFVASPIKEDTAQCVSTGKLLKKNNVALDIINLCTDPATEQKLQTLHEAVDNNDLCHYLGCKPGGDMLLSELVLNSSIMQPGDQAHYNQNLNDFGVDPELDPQLYMALRMSLEQEEERRRRANGSSAAASDPPGDSSTSVQGGATSSGEDATTNTSMTLGDIENEIKDLPGLQVVPLPRIMEMLMTCEGNSELLESLVYSLPEVDMEDERLKQLLEKLKELLPRLNI
ncbi:ubiquitin interaction motif family protein [Babesia ovis]|uniref:Ubiquitin interaction motif family protein n=1 Tax=Babesia ovis TaxID=5869 RepID=A0A9W5TAF8_BABOV|nr:ubiquitin interaction motif family protein [Babesia ovis]